MGINLTEYYVVTECGRTFAWSDTDYASLIRSLHYSGYKAAYIKPLSEYEAEVMAREEQERLIEEWRKEIEEDVRKSA